MSGIYKIIKIVFIISMSPGQWTAVMHFPVWNETFFVRFDLNNIVRVEKKKAVILFRQMFNLFSLTLLIRSKYLKITYCYTFISY